VLDRGSQLDLMLENDGAANEASIISAAHAERSAGEVSAPL
jgi:hypothetical protein